MSGLNEANTFSRLIYPYLENALSYPARHSGSCDEQTYIRTKGGRNKPFDAVFMARTRPVLLVEAKRQGTKLNQSHLEQAKEYAFGEKFAPIPPPFLLVSNGEDHNWFKRKELEIGEFDYVRCNEVPWPEALQAKPGGHFQANLNIKKTVKLMQKIRQRIFDDLVNAYFPEGFDLDKSLLGKRRAKFDEILYTRRSFVDPTLKEDERAIRSILSSIALSWTLKVLFLKILSDVKATMGEDFPLDVQKAIAEYGSDYPGIMRAEPYDALPFSKKTEEWLEDNLSSVRIADGLLFHETHNPIGDVWDGLVETEEHDLQVKSLGNVYTPEPIVKAMVNRAERALGSWKNQKVLEPACGSGHFVREIYDRMIKAHLPARSGDEDSVVNAHKKTLENIRAIDIDPFATQTTQLGIFLELYGKTGVWRRLAPKGKFDLGKIVIKADTLSDELDKALTGFKPTLIIGNPPYGVSVTDSVKEKFGLGSPDSYGCFIARGIDLLPQGGHLIFVVSSSFLTIRTHRDLREKIVNNTAISGIHILHRNAFRRRDVFPALLHVAKAAQSARENNIYKFTDAWPVHPDDPDYPLTLENWATATCKHKLPNNRFAEYEVPQSLLSLRLMPPNAISVEENLTEDKRRGASRILLNGQKAVYPIIGGSPTLFLMCVDREFPGRVRETRVEFPEIGEMDALEVKRGNIWVPFVKLWQIAQVRQGLATADDEFFLRKTPGVIPNARRRYIRDVDLRCTLSDKDMRKLTQEEKENGIRVIDPKRDKYFVPFDKGGEQDTAAGELRAFWSPVDYWVDWSERAVTELRKRASWETGTPKKSYIRNEQYYFQRGIICTVTGLYAPTYQLNFGGIFGHKANLISPFQLLITKYLLVLLTSKISRYFAKNMICSTADFSTDYFRHLPIPVPTNKDLTKGDAVFKSAVALQKDKLENADSESQLLKVVEPFVQNLFRLSQNECGEIEEWFKRHYPNFGREKAPTTRSAKATRQKVR